jgi:hypothetical protein
MESVISGGDNDQLISMMNMKVSGPTASFCTSREESSFFPSGGSTFSPTTTKELRFVISGHGWCDLSTCYLSCKVTNLHATAGNLLRPICPDGSALWTRARVALSGTTVETVESYSRVSNLYSKLMSPQKRADMANLAFGYTGNFADGSEVADTIAGAGGSKTILMSFHALGLWTQPKWIPLFALAGGLTLSIEMDAADQSFQTIANSSTNYQLSECRLLCDTISVDNSLMESYSRHLLSGKPLVIGPFKSHSVTTIAVAGAQGDLSIARSFTRAASVISTWHGPVDATRAQTKKNANDLYFPRQSADSDSLHFRLQIGSSVWPINPVTSLAESWMRMLKGTGQLLSSAHPTSISRDMYYNQNAAKNAENAQPSHINFADIEVVPHVESSGQNTTVGSTCVVSWKGLGTDANTYPSKCTIIIAHDVLIELTDGACAVLT